MKDDRFVERDEGQRPVVISKDVKPAAVVKEVKDTKEEEEVKK